MEEKSTVKIDKDGKIAVEVSTELVEAKLKAETDKLNAEAEKAKADANKANAEAEKAAAEAKVTKRVDINQIIKYAGCAAIGILAVGLNDSRILQNNPLWKKFNALF